MSAAPIAIFAYKRPQALKRMLEGLQRNERFAESPVIVFCDGARKGASHAERIGIQQVRDMAKAISGSLSLEVVEAPANKGLARSVIEGVTRVVEAHGRIIVVEDDAVLSPYFLRFMNDALDRFAEVENVHSVGSWNYFAEPDALQGDFFLRYPDSLAWATWKRSWDLFEKDGEVLKSRLKEKGLWNTLDADGRVSYFSTMLNAQIKGAIDSWAIRWTATSVLHGKVNYYPRITMALNKGFGADATHENAPDHNEDLVLAEVPWTVDSKEAVETPAAIAAWTEYVRMNFEGGRDRSLKTRVWRAMPEGMRKWYGRTKARSSADPAALAFEPVSRVFGFDRGLPIDRYYIERFLAKNAPLIKGHVMEIEESTYSDRFGRATRTERLRYTGEPGPGIRIGDLTKPETLPEGELDAFICTQTLNFIYDMKAAVVGLHHALKPGGHALVTVAGLVQISRFDADRWGDFWRFTPQSAQRLFEEVFGSAQVHVEAFGNSYAVACLHKGFATEECDKALLDKADPDYPLLITIKARKA